MSKILLLHNKFFNRGESGKHKHLTGVYVAKNRGLPLLGWSVQSSLCDTIRDTYLSSDALEVY